LFYVRAKTLVNTYNLQILIITIQTNKISLMTDNLSKPLRSTQGYHKYKYCCSMLLYHTVYISFLSANLPSDQILVIKTVHNSFRIANLDLMLEYGCEAWKQYNEVMQNMLRESQNQQAQLKKAIQVSLKKKVSEKNSF